MGFVSKVGRSFDLLLKLMDCNSHELKLSKHLVYCCIKHVSDYFHSKFLLSVVKTKYLTIISNSLIDLTHALAIGLGMACK